MAHRKTRIYSADGQNSVQNSTITRLKGTPKYLKHPPVTNTDNYPIIREEVEAAVKSLKPGKSAK